MPARADIQGLIHEAQNAQDRIRRKYLNDLSGYCGKRNVIIYASGAGLQKFAHIQGAALSITDEDMQGFMAACHGLDSGKPLDLILHSPGGSLDAAEQIVNYIRAKFAHVRAIIPQHAMSAATMIACACDEIVMAKHSAIGPTDPQIVLPRVNRAVFALPAQAYLDEFNQAKADIAVNPKNAAVWLQKLQEMPPGFLQMCTDTIARAKITVSGWLEKYMKLDKQAADRIGKWLGDSTNHKAHGKPIDAQTALNAGLKIVVLENDANLQDIVLSIFHSTMLTFQNSICGKLVENHNGKGLYTTFQ